MVYETRANQGQRQSRLSAMQEGIDILHKQVDGLQSLADELIGHLSLKAEKQQQELNVGTMAAMVFNFPTVARLVAERIATIEARIRDAFL